GLYLRSLAQLTQLLPSDTLVLPGHQLPFYGLHTRSDELRRHHAERCAAIAAACRSSPRSAAELVPAIFRHALDAHQMSFAFSEVLAHVNYMLREGVLVWDGARDGIERIALAGQQPAPRDRNPRP